MTFSAINSCDYNYIPRPLPWPTPVGSLRLHQESQQDIDEWRSGEPDHLSRSDAIRTLLWMGLAAAYEERKRNASRCGLFQAQIRGV